MVETRQDLARISVQNVAVVSGGIRPGDDVVVSPLAFPVNGMKLKPIDGGEQDAAEEAAKEPAS